MNVRKISSSLAAAAIIMAAVSACGGKAAQDDRTVISIQPYSGVTQSDAERLVERLRPHLDSLLGRTAVYEIRSAVDLPDSIRTGEKYDARAILRLERRTKGGSAVIGYTHDDIATQAHGYSNWGIFGLAFMGCDVAVVSDRRLKDRNDLWKVAEHEFIHAHFNYGHCPKDDPHCIMKDAKGKNPIHGESGLCSACRSRLTNH